MAKLKTLARLFFAGAFCAGSTVAVSTAPIKRALIDGLSGTFA